MSKKRTDDLFNRGLQYHQQGDLRRASECYSQVLTAQADHYLAMSNSALIAWDMGRADMALSLLKAAKVLAPANSDILKNLAIIQLKLGDTESAEINLRTALLHCSDDFDLRLELANVLCDRGKIDEAKSLLERLLQKMHPQLQILFKLGVICMRQGDADQAIGYLQQALVVDSDNSTVMNQLADQYLLLGRTEEARDMLEQSLRVDIGNTRALSLLAVLFNHVGDHQALLNLYNPEMLLRATSVSVPDGYSSIQDFNAELLACIEEHAEMRTDLPDRATANGLQSRSISALPSPVMAHMNELIKTAVEFMRDRCRNLSVLQFSQAIPDRYRIESWAVRLHDGGYQRPHVHPSGWLSGCYYLQVPAVIGQDESMAGCLEFGRPEEVYQVEAPFIFHSYQPVPGELISFPSYFWHNTVPFSSDEERISIAFDIRPFQ